MPNEDFRRQMKKYMVERIEMEERAIQEINDPELEQNYPNLAYYKKLEAYMAELEGLSIADKMPHESHQSHIIVPPKIDTYAV